MSRSWAAQTSTHANSSKLLPPSLRNNLGVIHAVSLPACLQGVGLDEVSKVLRARFGTSGIEEKAARPPKPQA